MMVNFFVICKIKTSNQPSISIILSSSSIINSKISPWAISTSEIEHSKGSTSSVEVPTAYYFGKRFSYDPCLMHIKSLFSDLS